jgi:hypothetical protein
VLEEEGAIRGPLVTQKRGARAVEGDGRVHARARRVKDDDVRAVVLTGAAFVMSASAATLFPMVNAPAGMSTTPGGTVEAGVTPGMFPLPSRFTRVFGVLAVVAVLGYFGIGRKRAARRDKAGRSSSARKRSE